MPVPIDCNGELIELTYGKGLESIAFTYVYTHNNIVIYVHAYSGFVVWIRGVLLHNHKLKLYAFIFIIILVMADYLKEHRTCGNFHHMHMHAQNYHLQNFICELLL